MPVTVELFAVSTSVHPPHESPDGGCDVTCAVPHVCEMRRKTHCGAAILLADSTLEELISSKFLGMHLDRGLTWNERIDHVLISAYYGLINPHLAYGVVLCIQTPRKAIRVIAKIKFRQSCREAFKQFELFTLPCLYILETTLFCMSKCAKTRGRDIHKYEARGRANYRTGRHRTVVYERLPSQAGVHFLNRLPNSIKDAPTPKALKTRLKHFLVSQPFYNTGEVLVFYWETAQLED
ncbi:hypothetical protein J6590_011186 [Homalodisca vitripennis]|nr:hypothetical protein J6590_011186 [Homalodisca vitripennis]